VPNVVRRHGRVHAATDAGNLRTFGKLEDTRQIHPEMNLTPAELEVMSDLMQGHSAKAIASQRDKSVNTVRCQITSILNKTGNRSQRELIARAAQGNKVNTESDFILHVFGSEEAMAHWLLRARFSRDCVRRLAYHELIGPHFNMRCVVVRDAIDLDAIRAMRPTLVIEHESFTTPPAAWDAFIRSRLFPCD
jgi:DNA-binding CsgD family transcriptional regulator